ncbi:uncharacterized protein PV09_07869 [Verruconis gallopava]|uniref:Heterokaryon incompatibility domain-containing protein n=1 Tax=Verruconis gallopava TaxID=253628 RepID=A0A0D2A2T0_9PEZI|nr:uncharacterized protein PV09_07869 [Verruconis gallopava]KIW00685.1 hypothetical protein PV09_07869 [Verruconis gallopava]
MLSSLFRRRKGEMDFQYEPLAAENHIRLITLLPGKWDSKIKCKLRVAKLEEPPAYKALSYVWGDVTRSEKILLNGKVCHITRNLDIALRYIRDEKIAHVLWVDALCINQSDNSERNKQVRIMGQIYKRAQVVLAWLGAEGDESDSAMELALELGQLAMSLPPTILPLTPQKLADAGFDAGSKNWAAFWRLMERPYWRRIWIIQEQHFASEFNESREQQVMNDRCLIGVGRKWLPRMILYHGWMLLMFVAQNKHAFLSDTEAIQRGAPQRHEPFQSFYLNTPSPITAFFITLSIANPTYSGPECKERLSALIRVSTGYLATDPRDMIFALHGIIGKTNNQLRIDYNFNLDTVYRETVEFAMKEYGTLSILEGNRLKIPTDYPTWYPISGNLSVTGGAWDNRRGHRASGRHRARKPKFSLDGKVLFLPGIVVGTVKEVIGPYWHTKNLPLQEQQVLWREYQSKLRLYWSKQEPERKEMMWRTFVLDQENDGSRVVNGRAPESFELAFRLSLLSEPGELPRDFMPGVDEGVRRYAFSGRFLTCFDLANVNYSFFDTENGFMGIGAYHLKPGDVVTILQGGAFCLVLRPKGEHYQLLGEAYVYGAMEGELVKEDDDGNPIGLQEFGIC